MRGTTFVILAALVVIGLLAYFYFVPRFRGAEGATVGEEKRPGGIAGAFQERNRRIEEEAGE